MSNQVRWFYERAVERGISEARARELALAVLTRKGG